MKIEEKNALLLEVLKKFYLLNPKGKPIFSAYVQQRIADKKECFDKILKENTSEDFKINFKNHIKKSFYSKQYINYFLSNEIIYYSDEAKHLCPTDEIIQKDSKVFKGEHSSFGKNDPRKLDFYTFHLGFDGFHDAERLNYDIKQKEKIYCSHLLGDDSSRLYIPVYLNSLPEFKKQVSKFEEDLPNILNQYLKKGREQFLKSIESNLFKDIQNYFYNNFEEEIYEYLFKKASAKISVEKNSSLTSQEQKDYIDNYRWNIRRMYHNVYYIAYRTLNPSSKSSNSHLSRTRKRRAIKNPFYRSSEDLYEYYSTSDYIGSLRLVGFILYQRCYLDEAIELFERALSLGYDDKDDVISSILGCIYFENQDYDEAISIFEQLASKSENTIFSTFLAHLYLIYDIEKKNIQKGISLIEDVLKHDSNISVHYLLLAYHNTYNKFHPNKKIDYATKLIRKAIWLNDNNSFYYSVIGIINEHDIKASIFFFEEAKTKEPNDLINYQYLAIWYLKNKNYLKAIENLEFLLKIFGKGFNESKPCIFSEEEATVILIFSLFKVNNHKKGLELFQDLIWEGYGKDSFYKLFCQLKLKERESYFFSSRKKGEDYKTFLFESEDSEINSHLLTLKWLFKIEERNNNYRKIFTNRSLEIVPYNPIIYLISDNLNQ